MAWQDDAHAQAHVAAEAFAGAGHFSLSSFLYRSAELNCPVIIACNKRSARRVRGVAYCTKPDKGDKLQTDQH